MFPMKKARILLMVFVLLLSSGAGAWLKLQQVIAPDEISVKENLTYDRESGKVNLLLVGVDENEGSHRSDTIAVLSLDLDNKTLRLLSLPRDTRVQIAGHGWQKLNHAYAYGKVKLLRETVVNYLGLPIHYHAVVNYDSFPKMIDMMGGVDLTVKKRLRYVDRAGGLYIDIQKGSQHMDGETALQYARFRNDALGDIGRVRRQQNLIQALLAKLKDPQIIPRIPNLVRESIKMVQTDMPVTQALQLASYMRDNGFESMKFGTLPGKPAYISGVSYWLGDLVKASHFLTDPVEGQAGEQSGDQGADVEQAEAPRDVTDIVKALKAPVAVLNGDGAPGVGRKGARELQRLGVDVAYVGNAKHFDYHYSLVYYPQGGASGNLEREGRLLADLTGVGGKLFRPSEESAYVTIVLGHDFERIIKRLHNSVIQ